MAQNVTRHGAHQSIHIRPFRVDRIGITSGNIEVHVEEDFASPDWSLLAQSAAPRGAPAGVPCVGAERSYDEKNAMAIYSYAFEGLVEGFGFSEVQFELDLSMEGKPIQGHPNWELIQKIYGWNTLKREFGANLPGASTGGGNGLSDSGKKEAGKRNPLYGTDSWLSIGGTFRKRYASREVPSSVMAGIGEESPVPEVAQSFKWRPPKGRQWLKLAPNLLRRGNAVDITEQFLMSGPEGINKDIYSSEAMTGGKGGGGGLEPSDSLPGVRVSSPFQT